MLNLKASIHLHEVEFVSLGVKDKLYRASVVVANCLGGCDGSLTDLLANNWANVRRRFLNYLLMASLDSAVPLIKVYIVPVFVTENLHFDVPWLLHVLFKDHLFIGKSFLCFTFASLELR